MSETTKRTVCIDYTLHNDKSATIKVTSDNLSITELVGLVELVSVRLKVHSIVPDSNESHIFLSNI